MLPEHKQAPRGREMIVEEPKPTPQAVVEFGSNPRSGQYSHMAGTQRNTSPASATRPRDGNGR